MKILFLSALLVVCCSVACGVKFNSGASVKNGAGVTKRDSRNIVGYSKIKASSAVDLNVVVTNGYSIVLKGDESVLPSVLTELQGDTLVISIKDNTSLDSKINVSVTLPQLNALELVGATHATVKDVRSDELSIDATGASSVEVAGQVQSLKVKATGASTINAEALKAEKADAESVGASKVTVSASDSLIAGATGASSVTYVGEPKSVMQNATDVSSISKK